jgi:hypothetical protein
VVVVYEEPYKKAAYKLLGTGEPRQFSFTSIAEQVGALSGHLSPTHAMAVGAYWRLFMTIAYDAEGQIPTQTRQALIETGLHELAQKSPLRLS